MSRNQETVAIETIRARSNGAIRQSRDRAETRPGRRITNSDDTKRRSLPSVLRLGATLAFLATIGYVITSWLTPSPVVRAFVDLPEIAVVAPAVGRLSLHVRPGQHVDAGDLIATLDIPSQEIERRSTQRHRLGGEIRALELHRRGVLERLKTLSTQRQRQIEAQSNRLRALSAYESLRDGAETDYNELLQASRDAQELLTERANLVDRALKNGGASIVESIEASLQVVLQSLVTASFARLNENPPRLTEAYDALQLANNGVESAATGTYSPEEIQDMRLLGQLKQELDFKSTSLRLLDELPVQYRVEAPHDGIVQSTATITVASLGDTIVTITDARRVHIRLLLDYKLWKTQYADAETISFFIKRTGATGEAKVLAIHRGITERDRHLKRLELVEVIAQPITLIDGPVPGEAVEILR